MIDVHAERLPGPLVAVLAGGASRERAPVLPLLADAGFRVRREPRPGALVVLLDRGTEVDRLRAIRTAAHAHPGSPVLAVIRAGTPNASLRRALIAGALAIVLEDGLETTLVATARALLAGQLVVPASLARQIAPRPLSHREKQVLRCVVLGETNRQIAQTLYLAESTVKTHLSSAFRKLDARSRSEAVARILDPESGYGVGVLDLDGRPLAAAG
jgi:two-component system NarL family response regulator